MVLSDGNECCCNKKLLQRVASVQSLFDDEFNLIFYFSLYEMPKGVAEIVDA